MKRSFDPVVAYIAGLLAWLAGGEEKKLLDDWAFLEVAGSATAEEAQGLPPEMELLAALLLFCP